jgi:hypothetical protein
MLSFYEWTPGMCRETVQDTVGMNVQKATCLTWIWYADCCGLSYDSSTIQSIGWVNHCTRFQFFFFLSY